jgi:hypothetical protein
MKYLSSISGLRRGVLLALCALSILGMTAGQAMAKDWTVLVYLAADNDLAPFGLIDINEMEQIGSTDDVDVVVQFDGSKEHSPGAEGSCRYHIQKDNDMKTITSPVVEDLGEIDMGNKQTLVEFLNWGMENYPSEKYFLVIWNHGNGWYQNLEESSIDFTAPQDVQAIMDAVEQIQGGGKEDGQAKLKNYVASKRIQALMTGAVSVRPFAAPAPAPSMGDDLNSIVAMDEGNEDGVTTGLSTTDIREAIEAVKGRLDRGKIELVGFDACLMAMIEVFEELTDVANFSLASMKTEPGDGWPYERFLGALVKNPSMDGGELGSVVVDGYTTHYDLSNQSQQNPFWKANTTLVTVDLQKTNALTQAMDKLAAALVKPELRELLWAIVIHTQHCGEIARTEPTVLVQLTAHRDILHFVQNIRSVVVNSAPNGVDVAELVSLCDDVINAHKECVVHFKRLTATPLMGVENAHGIAVSIPFLRLEQSYKEVKFGKTAWTDFIKFFKATPAEAQELINIMTGGKDGESEEATEEEQSNKFNALYDE